METHRVPKRCEKIIDIFIPNIITPTPRPRVTKHSTFTQQNDTVKGLIATLFMEYAQNGVIKIDKPLIVDYTLIYKYDNKDLFIQLLNKKYGDIDNIEKTIYDSMVKAQVIVDDIQIIGGEHYKAIGEVQSFFLSAYIARFED